MADYERYRSEIISQLTFLTETDLSKVMAIIDRQNTFYDVKAKEMALTVYDPDQLPDIVKTFLACKIVSGMSENTTESYKKVLEIFFTTVRKAPNNITTNDIRVFLYQYQQEHNVTNHTLDIYRAILSSFFEWATTEEYIPVNPAKKVDKIKYEQKQRKALTRMDMEKVRNACKDIREQAIIEFFYSTGCRVSELANVKIEEVDFDTQSVILHGKGKKQRKAYLNAKSVLTLQDYLKSRTDNSPYLFVNKNKVDGEEGTQTTRRGLEKIIQRLSKRVDISAPLSPHIIRHTTATMMLQSGNADITQVQKVLGHSSPNTTMIYAEVDDRQVQLAHSRSII